MPLKYPTFTIFSGISGMNKNKFIQNLINKTGIENQVLNLNFEDELLSEERQDNLPADIVSFLDIINQDTKLKLIETNFSWIAQKIEKRDPSVKHIFLNMHLSYYKSSEFFPPFIPHFFLQLFTKIPHSNIKIINLIDDVFSIWKKISDREVSGFLNTSLRLREILSWRSLENLRSFALKTYLSSREEGGKATNYLVSVRHPVSTFQNLIFNEKPPRTYLSFPISNTRKNAEDISEINKFRKDFHEIGAQTDSVVFDPVAIDELALETAMNDPEQSEKSIITLEKKHRWNLDLPNLLVDEPNWPINIPRHEIEEVSKDIRDQIRSRDFMLVDSSHFLAVHRPIFKLIPSKGVEAEIKHANEYGKKVIVYHPKIDQKDGNPTTHPFGEQISPFDVKEKFVEYLQMLIKQKKERDK